MRMLLPLCVLALLLRAVTSQTPEIEPNESKTTATTAVLGTSGITAQITGSSTGAGTLAGTLSNDTWLLQMPALPPGLYKHALTLSSTTPGHTATVRGLNQSAGVIGTIDVTFQTSATLANGDRLNQWYGFGNGGQLYYRVGGLSTTTAPYVATLSSTPVTPLCAGTYAPGNITISTVQQGHVTNTDLWVYDANFNPVPTFGNDDEPAPGLTNQSRLVRAFTPGTYYLAIAPTPFANDQPAAPDDRTQTATVLDRPGIVACGAVGTNTNVAFSMTDANGTTAVPAVKANAFDIVWARFEVSAIPLPPPFQTNSPQSSLDINGATTIGLLPARTRACVGQPVSLNFGSTLVGSGFDLAVAPGAALSGPSGCGGGQGGLLTPAGQQVNVNVGAPGFFFLFNFGFPPFAGPSTVTFASPNPLVVTAQLLVLDPSIADLFRLSAAAELVVEASTPIPTPIVGPAQDDTSITVNVGCLSFYNVVYTQIHPTTNGRVNFVAQSSTAAAAVATMQTGNPSVGAWADLDPSVGGTMTVSSPGPGIFRVDYNQVRYFGSTLASQLATFGIQFDANTNGVALDGLAGITDPTPLAVTMVLGISMGNLGATPGAATAFTIGGPNSLPLVTDMIYSSGQAGTLTPGLSRIDFTPIQGGPTGTGYAWTGS